MWMPDRTLQYGNEKYMRAQLQAVSANYLSVVTLAMREGRFFTETDDDHRRQVLVIGADVAEALFGPDRRVVGREVTFTGRPFTVVGVLEKRKGGFMGENEDDSRGSCPIARRGGCCPTPTSG